MQGHATPCFVGKSHHYCSIPHQCCRYTYRLLRNPSLRIFCHRSLVLTSLLPLIPCSMSIFRRGRLVPTAQPLLPDRRGLTPAARRDLCKWSSVIDCDEL